MRSSHTFHPDSAKFDDDHLVSCAGLLPIMALADQTGLRELLADKVSIAAPKITSGAANLAPKLTTLIAAMCAGADSIDDIDVLRSGGMKHLFGSVYAPSTIGTLLREFTFGHNRQLESVLREHLVALAARAGVLPGIAEHAFIDIDIDSLLRPVYGHAKQAPPTDTAKSPANRSSAKDSPHLRRSSALPTQRPLSPVCGCEQEKPDPAPALRAWSPRRSAPPGWPRDGQDHGARRLRLRQQSRRTRMH